MKNDAPLTKEDSSQKYKMILDVLQNQLEEKTELVAELENKIKEYQSHPQNLHAACDELSKVLDELAENRNKIFNMDYTIMNQERELETTVKLLDKLTKENKYLWSLLLLKGSENLA